MRSILWIGILGLMAPGLLCAQPDGPGNTGKMPSQGIHRAPPQEAIDACTGKAEGTVCAAGKTGTGICGYTPDKKYFACKPDHFDDRRGPGDPGGEGPRGSEGRPENSDVRQNEDGSMTASF